MPLCHICLERNSAGTLLAWESNKYFLLVELKKGVAPPGFTVWVQIMGELFLELAKTLKGVNES